jgi:RND family efflux transporter MFP subunit
MAVHARLGDTVKKGQLLMTVRSDDVSGGYSNYRMAVADEVLGHAQLERARDLYEHGAIALNDLQVAQDAEDKAKVAVDTAAEHLKLLGNDPDKMNTTVDVFSPVSGVITDQQVTVGSLVQAYNTPYPFTISDLSSIWVVCDVYENDVPGVKVGDTAQISLNAYPDRMFTGRVSNIGPVLDPNIRTAKVRIEIPNTEIMAAWKAGSDFVKVFPCSANGGPSYIRSLKGPFSEVPLIASGGVNQTNAVAYIRAGAAALGIGRDLIHQDAIRRRERGWITELARRYLGMIREARAIQKEAKA